MSITAQTSHPLVACATAIHTALDEVGEVEPASMTVADKERAVIELERAERRLAERKLRLLAACDDVADHHSARDVATWFAHVTRSEPSTVRADVQLARAVDRRWTRVRDGMAAGGVSAEQARVITRALDDLPSDLGPEVLTSAETLLVGYARDFRPSALRRIGRHILDVAAPEVAEAEEAKRLQREEQAAREKASLRFRPRGDGTTAFSGLLPDADTARWRTYLDAFTSPRHRPDEPDEPGKPGNLGGLGEADRIPPHRKLAHAFSALLEHLDPARLPAHGGDATTVMVTLSYDQLLARLGTAGLVDADLGADPAAGATLSAEQARRLACTARIIPVVLGGKGEILDVGRARRLFSAGIRKAIKLRDQRCRAEGCTIPADWCEAHHLVPWSRGGPTSLDNGVCLCSFHHHRIHDHRFTYQRLANGDVRFHRRT
ncbi:DUF222 domain-containing protein [Nocardioides sp. SYSU DS0651]|uniref:HNH endonuclease signature motif containing protein n=1 Tax=Nocardioides sp. SYSU DS0651 TaxID=3415955 RepID=UPI003F4BF32C